MRRCRRIATLVPVVALASLATGVGAPLVAQQPGPSVVIRTIPATPVRGSLITLILRPADSTETLLGVEGAASDEPLHFERSGTFLAGLCGGPARGDRLARS